MNDQATDAGGSAPRLYGHRVRRRGVLLLGAMSVGAIGLAGIATRGAFADTGTLAAQASSSATSALSGRHAGTGPGQGAAPAGLVPPAGGRLGFGPSAGTGPGFGPPAGQRGGWTVTTVNGTTIHAKRADGTTLTITTNGSTAFQVARPGQQRTAGALTDVGVGEQIDVIGALTGTGAVTAETVDVQPSRAGGRVTAVAGATITVTDGGATTQQIHLASGATYLLATATGNRGGSVSDIRVGSTIEAEGALGSDGSLLAQRVQVAPAAVDGSVKSIADGAIVIQRPTRQPRPAAAGTTATATAAPA
ncbi:MAG TPA: DUF5666 domain-containing protein, partial [Chloroflexota bacterium]|nr:DUF5666 domain-containing protein [Chloroflexota bacterium]